MSNRNLLMELFQKVAIKPIHNLGNKPLYLSVQKQNKDYIIKIPYVSNSNEASVFHLIKEALKKCGFRYEGSPFYHWKGSIQQFAVFASQFFEYLPLDARILAYEDGANNKYIQRAKEILANNSTEQQQVVSKQDTAVYTEQISRSLSYIKNALPTIRDYQMQALSRMLSAYYSRKSGFLLCDEQGLGKTVQAIAFLLGIYQQDMTILIVTPNVMIYEWYTRFHEFDTSKVITPRLIMKKPQNGYVNIVSYHTFTSKNLAPLLFAIKPQVIILDEIQNIKNLHSRRFKVISNIMHRLWESGHYPFVVGLTGTLVKNRPSEAYGPLYVTRLLPKDAFKFINFVRKFEGETAAYYIRTRMYTKYYRTIQSERAKSLVDYLTSTGCYIRRLKREVVRELPPKIRNFVMIDIRDQSNVQLAEALSREHEIASYLLSDIKIPRDVAQKISTYRHIIALEKSKYVIEYITHKFADKNKFLIFAHHNDVIDNLADAMKKYFPEHEVYVIDGRTKKEDRHRMITNFQSPNIENAIIIGGLSVLSEGVTLTSTDEIIFAEIDWVPATMLQAEDRIHRISQNSDRCIYHYIIAMYSLDQYIYNVIREKERYLKYVNTI